MFYSLTAFHSLLKQTKKTKTKTLDQEQIVTWNLGIDSLYLDMLEAKHTALATGPSSFSSKNRWGQAEAIIAQSATS